MILTTGSMVVVDNVTFVEQSGRLFLSKAFTPKELETIAQETLKQVKNDGQVRKHPHY